jgi:hypothetical protein
MKNSRWLKILLGVVLSGSLSPAIAHSFNLLFIAPINDLAGRSALNGFLLATREQDAHEFEESDGHLGGLDSYVFRIDSSVRDNRLVAIIRESVPLFATGNGISEKDREMLEKNDVVLVDPAVSDSWPTMQLNPGLLKLMNGGSFANAFKHEYGYTPGPDALHGYIAARIISEVVRGANGSVRLSAQQLKPAVEQALRSTTW